jgi:hypothetical protein
VTLECDTRIVMCSRTLGVCSSAFFISEHKACVWFRASDSSMDCSYWVAVFNKCACSHDFVAFVIPEHSTCYICITVCHCDC